MANTENRRLMYTCICNAIRECDLRKAARQHNGNAESVYAKLGKKPNCGNCLEEAEDVIREEREALIDPAIAA
ncbi:(2Fe-2S)-binding protein [Aurantiacibacter sp. MUD61]|uniref:(2Fe-2S)-binding protein n=1 Tax=Aurantiacibacter sp. MUD61 TaxID=3009083 RepID=UPI003FA43A1A